MTDLELKQFNGVYYIHNYIPIRRFPFYSFEEQLISQKLWGYKNYDLNAIEYFTSDLYDAINKILFIDPPFKRYIGLISVPTSSATKALLCALALSGYVRDGMKQQVILGFMITHHFCTEQNL